MNIDLSSVVRVVNKNDSSLSELEIVTSLSVEKSKEMGEVYIIATTDQGRRFDVATGLSVDPPYEWFIDKVF